MNGHRARGRSQLVRWQGTLGTPLCAYISAGCLGVFMRFVIRHFAAFGTVENNPQR